MKPQVQTQIPPKNPEVISHYLHVTDPETEAQNSPTQNYAANFKQNPEEVPGLPTPSSVLFPSHSATMRSTLKCVGEEEFRKHVLMWYSREVS
jgi:hypothetical protein